MLALDSVAKIGIHSMRIVSFLMILNFISVDFNITFVDDTFRNVEIRNRKTQHINYLQSELLINRKKNKYFKLEVLSAETQ